jgi:hypothetical protein
MPANTTFTAGAVLTAAQMNNLPWGEIDYVQVTANQTGIASGAVRDLTSLTSTKTFVAGRRIKISAKCQFTVGANACNVNLLIQEGATVLASQELFSAASSPQGRVASVIITPAAGCHTYKLTVSFGDNATNLLAASATNPSYILVEDIGAA